MARIEYEEGFTLIELLIAIFLSMIVLAAGYTVYEGSNRAVANQNLDNRMQDNARMAMDILARSARWAGLSVNFKNYSAGTQIDGLSNAIEPANGGSSAPDEVSFASAATTKVTELRNSAPAGSTTLVVKDPTQIKVGEVIAVGMAFSAKVTAKPGGNLINISTSTNALFNGEFLEDGVTTSPNGTPEQIYSVNGNKYWIDPTDPAHPCLKQNSDPLAEDIEDLQIAYGVDLNNNRVIDPDEWTWTPSNISAVRLIRITIVARTAYPDPKLVGVAQTIPDIEDHKWSQSPVKDGYRRFILTRVVKCRNLDTLSTL